MSAHDMMSGVYQPASYHHLLFLFIWYTVEFSCYLSIIAYVLYTFKFIGPFKMKENVPEAAAETWANTGQLLASAADIAKKFNRAFDANAQPPAPADKTE